MTIGLAPVMSVRGDSCSSADTDPPDPKACISVSNNQHDLFPVSFGLMLCTPFSISTRKVVCMALATATLTEVSYDPTPVVVIFCTGNQSVVQAHYCSE